MPADSTDTTRMATPSANPYLKTQVLTASPAELRQMLLDGALKFAKQASEGLEKHDYEVLYNGVTRCQAILMELINALDPKHEPDLCKKLSGLYTFMYTRLVDASTNRDAAILDEVIRLLEYERETWTMVLAKLARGDQGDAAPARSGLSVQG